MVDSNNTGGGPWHLGSTWDGGVVPGDGDAVNIVGTDNVTFTSDVDQSGWTLGMDLSIDSGASLLFQEQTNVDVKLQLNEAISGTGEFIVGDSRSGPLDESCTLHIELITQNEYIQYGNATKIQFFCLQPDDCWAVLTGTAASGQAVLDIDRDLTTGNNANTWDHSTHTQEVAIIETVAAHQEIREISSISTGPNKITLSTNLGDTYNAGAVVILLTRNIHCEYTGAGYGYGFRGSHDDSVIDCAMEGFANNIIYNDNIDIGGAWWNNNHNPLRNNSFGIRANKLALAKTGATTTTTSGATVIKMENCIVAGWTNGWYVNYSPTEFVNTDFRCNITSMSFQSVHPSKYINCNFKNSTTGIVGADGLFHDCEFNNATDLSVPGDCSLVNTKFDGSTEIGSYTDDTYRNESMYVDSTEHDKTSTLYKGWTLGGKCNTNASTPPTGYDRVYELQCENASYHNFYQKRFEVYPGDTLDIIGEMKMTNSQTVTIAEFQLIDVTADPMVDSNQSVLASDSMVDLSGPTAWEELNVTWTNNDDLPKPVLFRIISKHALADFEFCWKQQFSGSGGGLLTHAGMGGGLH